MLSTSDRYLKATATGRLQIEAGWTVVPTRVRREASIGGGAVVLCGVTKCFQGSNYRVDVVFSRPRSRSLRSPLSVAQAGPATMATFSPCTHGGTTTDKTTGRASSFQDEASKCPRAACPSLSARACGPSTVRDRVRGDRNFDQPSRS